MSSPFYQKGLSWQGQGGNDYETGLDAKSDKEFVSKSVPSHIKDTDAANFYIDFNKPILKKVKVKKRRSIVDVVSGTINKIFNK
jgi:hypothetical protein|tara:strand:- start:556 stop:807 length:252 start_codon:yes stop_codon:yes gene_type:complete